MTAIADAQTPTQGEAGCPTHVPDAQYRRAQIANESGCRKSRRHLYMYFCHQHHVAYEMCHSTSLLV